MQAAAISSRNLMHSLMLILATLAIPGPAVVMLAWQIV